jgi:hypothetical protein
MGSGNFQWFDGDVKIGNPAQTIPSNFFIEPHRMTYWGAPPGASTAAGQSWAKGSITWNSGAAAGGPPGWMCILDHTLGTLNGGATTGSITTGTKLLTVNSVTGLTVGNFIDVVADGGGNAVTAGRVVNINSTTKLVTLLDNATGTATDKAVSFHNHTTAEAFRALGSIGARKSGVTAAIATGTAVTHGLGVTPTKVLLTAAATGASDIYVDALGATTFTVNFAGGGSRVFYWEAIE